MNDMNDEEMLEEEFDFDDLEDLPSYVNPVHGVYSCKLSGRTDKDNKIVYYDFTFDGEEDPTFAKGVQDEDGNINPKITGTVPEKDDLVTIRCDLTKSWGQGTAKNILASLVKAGVLERGKVYAMTDAVKNVAVFAEFSSRKSKPKKGEEAYVNTSILDLAVR